MLSPEQVFYLMDCKPEPNPPRCIMDGKTGCNIAWSKIWRGVSLCKTTPPRTISPPCLLIWCTPHPFAPLFFHDILFVSPCNLVLPQQSSLMILQIQQKVKRISLGEQGEGPPPTDKPLVFLLFRQASVINHCSSVQAPIDHPCYPSAYIPK